MTVGPVNVFAAENREGRIDVIADPRKLVGLGLG